VKISAKLEAEKRRVAELEEELAASPVETTASGIAFSEVMDYFLSAWQQTGHEAMSNGLCSEKHLLKPEYMMRVPTVVMMDTAFRAARGVDTGRVADQDISDVILPGCDITISVSELEAMDRYSNMRSFGLRLARMQSMVQGMKLTSEQLTKIRAAVLTHDVEVPDA